MPPKKRAAGAVEPAARAKKAKRAPAGAAAARASAAPPIADAAAADAAVEQLWSMMEDGNGWKEALSAETAKPYFRELAVFLADARLKRKQVRVARSFFSRPASLTMNALPYHPRYSRPTATSSAHSTLPR